MDLRDSGWNKLCEKYTSWGEIPKGETHGWIQWKGTDVCMDFRCECGMLSHIDCDFTYLIQCGACKRIYWPCAHIKMLEMVGEDRGCAEESNPKVTDHPRDMNG